MSALSIAYVCREESSSFKFSRYLISIVQIPSPFRSRWQVPASTARYPQQQLLNEEPNLISEFTLDNQSGVLYRDQYVAAPSLKHRRFCLLCYTDNYPHEIPRIFVMLDWGVGLIGLIDTTSLRLVSSTLSLWGAFLKNIMLR